MKHIIILGDGMASKQYILKLINLQDKKVTLQPEVSGFKRPDHLPCRSGNGKRTYQLPLFFRQLHLML